jgi:hypothetical protein
MLLDNEEKYTPRMEKRQAGEIALRLALASTFLQG